MNQFAKKLKGILVKAGKLENEKADELIAEARDKETSLSEVVVKNGIVSEAEAMRDYISRG